MCLKPACSICNKTVSHRNFKSIYLKCNNLRFDGQLIKK